MALCVHLAVDGTLVPAGQAPEECAGYVLISGAEYGVVNVFGQLVEVPSQADALSWFVGPFGLILFLFLVARIAGRVAGFFDSRR